MDTGASPKLRDVSIVPSLYDFWEIYDRVENFFFVGGVSSFRISSDQIDVYIDAATHED